MVKGAKHLVWENLQLTRGWTYCCNEIVLQNMFIPCLPYSAFKYSFLGLQASLIAQLVKSPPAIQKTLVRSLGWEDPLEKETATHSSFLAWRFP